MCIVDAFCLYIFTYPFPQTFSQPPGRKNVHVSVAQGGVQEPLPIRVNVVDIEKIVPMFATQFLQSRIEILDIGPPFLVRSKKGVIRVFLATVAPHGWGHIEYSDPDLPVLGHILGNDHEIVFSDIVDDFLVRVVFLDIFMYMTTAVNLAETQDHIVPFAYATARKVQYLQAITAHGEAGLGPQMMYFDRESGGRPPTFSMAVPDGMYPGHLNRGFYMISPFETLYGTKRVSQLPQGASKNCVYPSSSMQNFFRSNSLSAAYCGYSRQILSCK